MYMIYLFLVVTSSYVETLHWQSDTWSPCKLEKTCSFQGYKVRNVTCYDVTVKVDPLFCEQEKMLLKRPSNRMHCIPDRCISKSIQKLKMVKTSWSKCLKTNKKDLHFNGTQQIDGSPLTCGRSAELTTYTKMRRTECHFYYEPNKFYVADMRQCEKFLRVDIRNVVERQLCFRKCVRACALTLWTKWTRCKYCRKLMKYKTRDQAFSNLPDSECGILIRLRKMRRLNSENTLKQQYRISSWRQVSILFGKKGFRLKFSIHQRSLSCVDSKGDICTVADPTLATSTRVQVSDRDCLHDNWSPWSRCIQNGSQVATGKQKRTRHIFTYPLGHGKSCNSTIDERPCDKTTRLVTEHFVWFSGNWSSCYVDKSLTLGEQKCQILKKTRHVFCTRLGDESLTPFNNLKCASVPKPNVEKICHVICLHSRCFYSDWSEWKNCSHGYIKRNRTLLHGSRYACILTEQKRPCKSGAAQWERVTNGICKPYGGDICGEGILKPQVLCKIDEKITDESQCNSVTKPSSIEACSVTCKQGLTGKCVLSPWSGWGICRNSVKKRTRNILYGDNGCLEAHIIESKNCSTKEYFWVPSTWGVCELTNQSLSCGEGKQTRDFHCVENLIGNVINKSYCLENLNHTQVSETRNCYACKNECILSPWSQWDPDCSSICAPSRAHGLPRTHRQRFVLSYGGNVGLSCNESLMETKSCPSCLDYHWVTEKWDICTHDRAPTMGVQSGEMMDMRNGYQIRNVYCSDGSNVVPDSLCNDAKPIESRDCHIDWYNTCNLKPWSEWSECEKFCGNGTQTRSRPLLPGGCKIGLNIKFNQSRPCNTHPCSEFEVEEGDWTECQLIGASVSCDKGFNVNFGIKIRNVTCFSTDGKIVPLRYCEDDYDEEFPTKKRCVLPCSNDCQISQWSVFSECSAKCGVGMSARTRRIYQHASSDRPSCPSSINGQFVMEQIPCKVRNCHDDQWVKGHWGPCDVGINTTCGKGTKKRSANCVKMSTERPSNSCLAEIKPRIQKQCKIPCQTNCLVSQWSTWTPCDYESTNRKREITRPGDDCPALYQERQCAQNKYKWRISNWSSCFLNKGFCGKGWKQRIVECIKTASDLVVPPSYCSQLERTPSAVELCKVSCEEKCQLSHWTTWTECNAKCGQVAHQTRQREGHGNCNGVELKETLQCKVLPCYTLTTGDWSSCQPDVTSSCGVGTQRRSGRCMRDDGNIMDLHHCVEFLTDRKRLERECSIPCWNDCILTPWSSWSSCFKSCSPPESHAGQMQLRRRHVLQKPTNGGVQCPPNLEESRACDHGTCFEFDWRINASGEYKCTRSDGLTVSTGCKPVKGMHKCDCSLVANVICVQKEYCMCQEGFLPNLNGEQRLVHCERKNGVSSKNEGKASVSLAGIICISLAACVGYCLLFIVLFFFYRRRKKQKLERTSTTTTTHLLQPLNNNKNMTEMQPVIENRQRNLLLKSKQSQDEIQSCSDVSSTGLFCSESTPLQPVIRSQAV